MIPADVVGRLQASADTALRPVAPTQEITDKLSDLTAGQRVMAQIQALLPNGTYRALINQRNITLALPFSARSGDSLELEVTESDGKLTLAVVAPREGEGKSAREAVSATLSRTGQLISNLFSGAREAKNDAALPLNGNRPIASAPPGNAQDLLPLLKEAITRSGMFYESHQAEWVEGRFSKAALLQEPQGRLSSPKAFSEVAPGPAHTGNPPATPAAAQLATAEAARTRAAPSPGTMPELLTPQKITAEAAHTGAAQSPGAMPELLAPQKTAAESTGQLIAPQAHPIVHQQLEALASQTFVWQGQIWPGQEMRWEIEEDNTPEQGEEDQTAHWSTRLNLHLPHLGEINARIQLNGNQANLLLISNNVTSCALMQAESDALRQQLDVAGISLAAIGISTDSDVSET